MKEKFIIQGPQTVNGEVSISGAKNSALPILFATLLTSETVIIRNLPDLDDVKIALKILSSLGSVYEFLDENVLQIKTETIFSDLAAYELVHLMRASVLALGPLLSRHGSAQIALPGGCAIGARPVDLHLKAMESLGAIVSVENGFIYANADTLKGHKFYFDEVSVTGTENMIMAAVLANGQTIIENCAKEPEIIDLCQFLNNLGASIKGYGSDIIVIDGVSALHGGEFKVQADRIETGSFLVAAAATSGYIRCINTDPLLLEAVLVKLEEANAIIKTGDNWIELDMRNRKLNSVDISTAPYPAFPTDLQAQFMVLNVIAEGDSIIKENIFENRFMHVGELNRMGADLKINDRVVFTNDSKQLTGAQVQATDLRASISLVIAALVAEGETEISSIKYIDRGYEKIEEKFMQLSINIERVFY